MRWLYGFFGDTSGRIGFHSHCACELCPAGTFANMSGANGLKDCSVCPSGTQTNLAAGYRACKCLPGFSRSDRFGLCEPCNNIQGVRCEYDSRILEPGYWWTFGHGVEANKQRVQYESFLINLALEESYNRTGHVRYNGQVPTPYACPFQESCLGDITAGCTNGTTGPLCAVCDKNYYSVNSNCIICPDSNRLSVFLGILIVAVIVALVA